ncbi:MAG TPA: CocE/NonD family hydrolase [Acidimicrobiales bacterium]|nr:CocE/NonD family hydrolase [Acidimicrobiales bacterium]
MGRRLLGIVLSALAIAATTGFNHASEAGPDLARPFTPTPLSPAIYDIAAPVHTIVKASDGVDLFVEAWLPAPRNGNVPPARVPVVVVATPYVVSGTIESQRTLDAVVRRGYGYVQLHVRGFGDSGGCVDLFGPKEADDTARVIEWLGTEAPYSNGVVGGYGVSYPGGTLVNAAGRGDPEKTKYLKAIVIGAPEVSEYDARWIFDGVPSFLLGPLHVLNYMGQSYFPGLMPGLPVATPQHLLEKPPCQPAHMVSTLDDLNGDFTPYFAAHENRPYVPRIKAAVLMTHGHADLVPIGGVPPMVQAGLFDHIAPSTPKAGIFGVFGHSNPPRADWVNTMVAWFDKWLKGLDTGADQWPVAQVQGTDGQWRAEPNWPGTGGPAGQLALGKATLGATAPSGQSGYIDLGLETTLGRIPGTFLTFETPPLPGRLEMTGQPVLDLWLKLGLPDAHIAAKLETFDAAGNPIPNGFTYGLRSASHLAPLVDNRFGQAKGKLPRVAVPLRVPVRFQPTDLVVPAGGKVRITIAGSVIVNTGLAQLGIPEPLFLGPSQPSFLPTPVNVLHNCAWVSALRFEMPSATPDLLRVDGAPAGPVMTYPASNAGGLASAPVCGQLPYKPAL